MNRRLSAPGRRVGDGARLDPTAGARSSWGVVRSWHASGNSTAAAADALSATSKSMASNENDAAYGCFLVGERMLRQENACAASLVAAAEIDAAAAATATGAPEHSEAVYGILDDMLIEGADCATVRELCRILGTSITSEL